ncbi:transposase [Yoonia sp.]|uniref:transposase n=1 Tax=Yoonia sp. TaxID=2212373 RepID=UPI00358FD29C
MINNLRNRAVECILIAVVDGLKGFPGAVNAAFPDIAVQTCLVHLVCQPLNSADGEIEKHIAKDLNRVTRKTTKIRRSFQTDEAATKLIYLAIHSSKKAVRAIRKRVAA